MRLRATRLTAIATAVRRALPVFSPSELFASGAPGLWYDLSLTDGTLFQDAAGTLPAALEQPVGLVLDKSKGLVLGPELVTNGTFDTNINGWSVLTGDGATSTISYNSGALRVVPSDATARTGAYQSFSVTAGKAYLVTGQIKTVSSAENRWPSIAVGNGTGSDISSYSNRVPVNINGISPSGFTPISAVFRPTGSSIGVLLLNGGNNTVSSPPTFEFDNISVRELLGRDILGNHAFQTTSANRPVLSARYNLLTKTEQFDDATAWATAGRATITANNTTDPLGGNTADKITETVDNGTHRVSQGIVYPNNTNIDVSFFLKKGTRDWVWISCNQSSNVVVQYFNLNSISVGTNTTTGSGISKVSASIIDAGNDWRKCTLTCSVGALADTDKIINCGLASADGTATYAGSTSDYGYIWGADLRVANDGINLPPYQRVNTATDYDTVGFPLYLRFNGSTQFLQTDSIDFSSTDKVLVAAGVRKLGDAAAATVAELSANSGMTPNTFAVFAPSAAAPNYAFRSSGTSNGMAIATTFASPVTNVLVGLGEVASDTAILRINGTQAASSTADQGTGNLGFHPLYIGARAGTSLFLNGRLYSLIIAGIKPTDAQILGVETYINSLTKAF